MTQSSFSSLNRRQIRERLQSTSYDVLIIGGGITGAGIALDAAVRGLNTAIIEMQDFAAGTSSRSTKLVHGGLRYLKQGEINLVREVGRERAIVYDNAPHVVVPERMLMPIIQGGTYGRWATSIGLYVYDWLAGVKRAERRTMLSKEQTLKKEPLLRSDKLKAGGYYVEYRTDDARLTIEIMKSAAARGVTALNYIKAESFVYDDNGHVAGVTARDMNDGTTIAISAAKVVNAAGPWVDTLRELDRSKTGKRLHLTKGIHIVIDQSRFPLRQAIYFDTPDGRMVFAIPRDGKTYIGTTDTNYEGELEHPRMTREDLLYLLRAANYMFPTISLTENDVESSWAGLRPLIHEDGKSPSELSRKDEIFLSPSGLITIAGGKLTGYRKMAERVVNLVTNQLGTARGKAYPSCSTDRIVLSGGDVPGQFADFCSEWTRRGQALGLSEARAKEMVMLYGMNVQHVFSRMEYDRQAGNPCELPADVMAALVYGVEAEMVTRPVDFIARRTGAVNFRISTAKEWLKPVARFMAEIFGWDAVTEERYVRQAEEEIEYAEIPVE
ncbi:glycerol-3-phosphate dehydrogenase/oxidase [Paenibacillus apiarius]|uniref:Glycerol-3-phosphate dehydrogenase n=1 Tax=Paenibacillus apiarius TaxID=46240 RepID=A0ABT4DPS8_9BACL|nr:glycerol-3-phosphate dehydrogenase/oxidase [Paenibacillus apiarius]MCY9513505.1 glycerol-3-phosphate dehydrogenase/oxidase [Paenibacillus apiarius]MCY9518056.1 glycerol-3-phosphate dehydrogenase/oxidase [Paenibacillus apiarius]MCY9551543.1 glycerol-3-phosphate dehydrogenase/oxidase [Paenibacillus apiarius]MCY9558697.1 glycerol-3-phosphate dehydrogenase/oxidase [Paenibacillus apiarius]MCY9683989.1 glycerol-3-phosphate dehydrogenase/oxidase [Paenibacillus apiarius]